MGNCMQSEKGEEEQEKMEINGREVKIIEEVENKSKGVRVKMVLTKEELQWLMMQLKNRSESSSGRIEDVLGGLEKVRKRPSSSSSSSTDCSWKPSLHSITELPELL
ncbi:hypothetical protein RND81_06G249900 [Saponaria officinalis]|uniref:Uncharacterized protein n=1 Tax=Saponaria officinalis TaxID=3572 RepID=A0AAW1KG48_SAPOF